MEMQCDIYWGDSFILQSYLVYLQALHNELNACIFCLSKLPLLILRIKKAHKHGQ